MGPEYKQYRHTFVPHLHTQRDVKELNTIAGAPSLHVTGFISTTCNACSSAVSTKTRKTDLAGSPIPALNMTTAAKDLRCRIQDPVSN